MFENLSEATIQIFYKFTMVILELALIVAGVYRCDSLPLQPHFHALCS